MEKVSFSQASRKARFLYLKSAVSEHFLAWLGGAQEGPLDVLEKGGSQDTEIPSKPCGTPSWGNEKIHKNTTFWKHPATKHRVFTINLTIRCPKSRVFACKLIK